VTITTNTERERTTKTSGSIFPCDKTARSNIPEENVRQLNPGHAIISYFFQISFNIIPQKYSLLTGIPN
jgi:hypothetical protein